jgi:hypothetical protein
MATSITPPTLGTTQIVRVAVPLDVHNNLDKMVGLQKDILKKLGCAACCSGFDIRFQIERQFLVDKNLAVTEVLR